MITTTQQLKVSDMQIEQLRRQNAHAQLVEKELQLIPENTRIYEGVGRMFLLQPAGKIKTNLAEKIVNNADKIGAIETTKSYLERSMKESEDNLRELVLSKQKERS